MNEQIGNKLQEAIKDLYESKEALLTVVKIGDRMIVELQSLEGIKEENN